MNGAPVRVEAIDREPLARFPCCGGPSTLDVYADGVYYGYFCRRCVHGVPGLNRPLGADDVIPNHWTVYDPNGDLKGFYGVGSAEGLRKAFDIPADHTVVATTARVLFRLPAAA